ncbi:GNAT family N-acetyltransferase [Labilibaculum sp.]|uniref:GNAT family N-acetyltransferase n=1 Tax=Labilibaculum sp. TaxID=2060723 RepID=UPI002AA60A3E|nr:GNAT family N-acetyltransferase [Labilibaculum sp.]
MQNLRIVKHQDVSDDEVLRICNIKSAFGAYSIESQEEWMDNHLKNNDIHFLLYENNELIAYLNLIDIHISINSELINAYGIGNVCSKINGRGYGKKLLLELNNFLLSNNKIAYLFCKDSLVDFYKKYNWILLKNDNSKIIQNDIKSMLFNFSGEIDCLEYRGDLF